ncbi:MAG: type II toxin-antitoxin system VapC family toxin [Vicinamibacterales bacterium]
MITRAHRICFDSNALIYLLEVVDPYFPWMFSLFESVHLGQRQAVISVVTETELMIKPLRDGDLGMLRKIEATLSHENVQVAVADREVARRAARVRAETYIKLPDAFIVATAIVTGCDALVGNDELCAKRVTEIPYIYLDDAVRSTS